MEQSVARRQIDVVSLMRIPTSHDQTPRIGIRFDLVDQAGNLINAVTIRIVTAKRTPEITIDRSKITSLSTKS